MKLNELIQDFTIYASNEEKSVLERMDDVVPLQHFNDRDRVIIEGLVRKSLVSKVVQQGVIMVVRNEF